MKKFCLLLLFVFLLKGTFYASNFQKDILKEYAIALDLSEKEVDVLASFLLKNTKIEKENALIGAQSMVMNFRMLESTKKLDESFLLLKEKGYIKKLPQKKLSKIFIANIYCLLANGKINKDKKAEISKKIDEFEQFLEKNKI